MHCTDCTYPLNQPNQFSLTNYIEIVKIDSICEKKRNQFEMTPYSKKTIRENIAKFNITPTKYTPYKVIQILENSFKLTQPQYTDPIERKTIYFFINKQITCQLNKLETKLYQLWSTTHISKTGNTFTASTIMPTRGKPLSTIPTGSTGSDITGITGIT